MSVRLRSIVSIARQLHLQRRWPSRALIAGLSLVLPAGAFSHPLVAEPVASSQTIVAPNGGGVATVRASTPTTTKQGIEIYRGISQATAGTKQLSMNRIVLQPGTQGLRHQHRNAETVIYVLEGQVRTLIGLHGEVAVENKAGDFLFIPAGVWHQPMNVSDRPVVAIEARADADDQSNVILAPNQP